MDTDRIERTFHWTLSKLLGFIVVGMGFALELALIILNRPDGKYFLGAVTAGSALVISKQVNDTLRTKQ